MFGNEFIDYCAANYDTLVNVANKVDAEYIAYLQEYGKSFALFYSYMQANQRADIPVNTLLELGVNFQQICLLTFLLHTKGLNIRMSSDFSSVNLG